MKIIAVDEDWWDRERLRKILKRVGPKEEIFVFDRCADALAFAQENVVDVAFIDLGGIHTPGFFLARNILKQQRTNVIFTKYERDHLQEALELRVSGYILKPLQHEEVLIELQNLRYPLSLCGWIDKESKHLSPNKYSNIKKANTSLKRFVKLLRQRERP